MGLTGAEQANVLKELGNSVIRESMIKLAGDINNESYIKSKEYHVWNNCSISKIYCNYINYILREICYRL